MLDLVPFYGVRLRGDYIIESLNFESMPFADPLGRPALGMSSSCDKGLHIVLATGQTDIEQSVSLYHEVLEIMAVTTSVPVIRHTTNSAQLLPSRSMPCCNSTDFRKNNVMAIQDELRIQLIKPAMGTRILRLTHVPLAINLECALNSRLSVVQQKTALTKILEIAIAELNTNYKFEADILREAAAERAP